MLGGGGKERVNYADYVKGSATRYFKGHLEKPISLSIGGLGERFVLSCTQVSGIDPLICTKEV